MSILISICMPTYNRREKALRQANNILSQIKDYPDIEFIISDNASTDGTSEYIKQNCNVSSPLLLFRQPKNLGLVGNLYFLFKKAKGQYVWFISDDDIILDNSIDKIYKLIIEEKRSFYLLNFKTERNGQVSDISYWNRHQSNRECFKSNWGGFGLLSAQILKKQDFNDIYKKNAVKYNLCQPVAISLYGLFIKKGRIVKEEIFLTHHAGDYSWAKYALQVASIYNFDAIDDLEDIISLKEKKVLYDIVISNNKIRSSCVLYILKYRDVKFLFRLIKNGYCVKILIQLMNVLYCRCLKIIKL